MPCLSKALRAGSVVVVCSIKEHTSATLCLSISRRLSSESIEEYALIASLDVQTARHSVGALLKLDCAAIDAVAKRALSAADTTLGGCLVSVTIENNNGTSPVDAIGA